MKLQQLRYALEVYRNNLNISEAANALFTSQPGISKQIRLLEEELGVQIFIRSGKRIVAVSQPGKAILQTAEKILHDIQNIKNIGREFTDQDSGTLTVATTYTDIQHLLPDVVTRFAKRYPKVRINLRPANPETIAQTVSDGHADFALTAEHIPYESDLRGIPCSYWKHGIVVPNEHPLSDRKAEHLSVKDLVQFPLISYEFSPSSHNIARAFRAAGINETQIALTAPDDRTLKHYVKQGLGVGLLAEASFDEQNDTGLHLIDASRLFDLSCTQIIMRADTYLRGYIYDFIRLLSPDLVKERVDQLLYADIEEDFSI